MNSFRFLLSLQQTGTMFFSLALFLTALQALGAYASFQYTDCTPAGSPMHITHIDISPYPIQVPGDITVSFDGYTSDNVSHATLHLGLKKKHVFLGLGLNVPCLDHIGTCDYDDICTILDDMEKGNWGFGALGNMSRQIQAMFAAQQIDATHCPFQIGAVHVSNFVVKLPHVASALSWFAAGDYHVEMIITDKATHNQILCVKADINIQQAHHGILGRK